MVCTAVALRLSIMYEQAVTELFEALDHWETILNQQRYLCGDQITLADWCMHSISV